MLWHPACNRRGRNCIAVPGFDLLNGFAKRVPEIVECHPVQDETEGMGLVAQQRRCGREHATAQLTLPQLNDLKFLASCAFADDGGAAAMRAARRRVWGVWGIGRA